jgi:hypothetical protein
MFLFLDAEHIYILNCISVTNGHVVTLKYREVEFIILVLDVTLAILANHPPSPTEFFFTYYFHGLFKIHTRLQCLYGQNRQSISMTKHYQRILPFNVIALDAV